LWDTGRHFGETWAIEEGDDAGERRAESLEIDVVRPGDIVINLGAGDITNTGPELLSALSVEG
jgi:UDP-N-acetylmuramate-alanine ligase